MRLVGELPIWYIWNAVWYVGFNTRAVFKTVKNVNSIVDITYTSRSSWWPSRTRKTVADVERPVSISKYVQIMMYTYLHKKLTMTFRGKYSIRTKLQLMTGVCNRYRILRSRFDCGFGMKSKRIPLCKWKKGRTLGKNEWKHGTQILENGTMPILICWYEPWNLPKKAVIDGSQKWNFYQQWEDAQETIKLGTNILTVTEKKKNTGTEEKAGAYR